MSREERLQHMLNDFLAMKEKNPDELDELAAENYKTIAMYLDVWIPPPIRSERLKDDRYMGLKWSSATSTVISICNILNAIIAPLIGTIVDGTK